MTTPRPAPYPADTRAKGWRFELDMERFKESDTWLKARNTVTRSLLVMLWAESWHQKPCGTLPDDDDMIATLMGMTAEEYAPLRDILRRGWWLGEDGRLYHDVMVARVLAMLSKRDRDAKRIASKRVEDSRGESLESRQGVAATSKRVASESDTKHQIPISTPKGVESGGKPPRATRKCPASFAVTDEMRAWAAADAPGIDVDRETAKFRDHTFKTAHSEWGGAWRNWIRRAFESLSPPSRASPRSFREQDAAANAERISRMTGGLLGKRPAQGTLEIVDDATQFIG